VEVSRESQQFDPRRPKKPSAAQADWHGGVHAASGASRCPAVSTKKAVTPSGWLLFSLLLDSKGGSWQHAGGMLQPPWLFRRKASPAVSFAASGASRCPAVSTKKAVTPSGWLLFIVFSVFWL